MGKEMQLTVHIGDYKMDQVILDLGLDANILPRKTRERMGEPKLERSTVQLCMANQQKITPLGRLPRIMIDIEGVKILADFEVIEVVEDGDPYPALLVLDWAIAMRGVINLKNHSMIFENNGMCVIIPLDPEKGERSMEPASEEAEIGHS